MRAYSVAGPGLTLIAAASVLLSPETAQADITGDSALAPFAAPEPTRRGGFVLGTNSNTGIGWYRGWPNEIEAVGDPAQRVDVDAELFSGGSLWFGVAFRDWLTFGLGTGGGNTFGDDAANGWQISLRIESYPLLSLGGEWEDVGVTTEFGAGSLNIEDDDGELLAEGGNMAVVSFGVFYEAFQWWKLNFGPALTYTHMNSQSLTANSLGLGIRTTFYSSP